MTISFVDLKGYYEELYKLINNQSKILNNILDIHKGKYRNTDAVVSNLCKIIISLKNLIDKNSGNLNRLSQSGNIIDDEMQLTKLILDNIDCVIECVFFAIAYVYKINNIKHPRISMSKLIDISKLNEEELFNNLIVKISDSVKNLEYAISILDKYME